MPIRKIGLLAITISLSTFISSLILSIIFYKNILLGYLFTLITGETILISFTNLGDISANIFLLGLVLLILGIHWKILSRLYKNVSTHALVGGRRINANHLLYIGILCSLSILLSSPIFFTKDKIHKIFFS